MQFQRVMTKLFQINVKYKQGKIKLETPFFIENKPKHINHFVFF